MSAPIAVFYHCVIHGAGDRIIDPDYALTLIASQMEALKRGGLMDATSNFFVGVNGPDSDAFAVACLCDNKAVVIQHGREARTEIPTLNVLRGWLPGHPGWNVLYHHTKGVSTPNQQDGWRRRMENVCVLGWNECVKALEMGYDAAGCHWLTPEGNPGVIASPFFGGTFWWAKSDYLLTLPPLPEATWQNRYEAETWIGKGPRRPRVLDFAPGWPTP